MIEWFDDLKVGMRFKSEETTVSKDDILRFAAEFDPQPFHVDEEAARGTMFGGLAGSGWHTAALTMRLMFDSDFKPAWGIIGAGLEELRWPNPMRPGDELHIESEVLEIRLSKSRPDQGWIKMRTATVNQKGEPVQTFIANLIVPKRPA